jgi:hypothetical protein
MSPTYTFPRIPPCALAFSGNCRSNINFMVNGKGLAFLPKVLHVFPELVHVSLPSETNWVASTEGCAEHPRGW